MRSRQRRRAVPIPSATTGKGERGRKGGLDTGGHTLIEVVAALSIFAMAAAGTMGLVQGQISSYAAQSRKEQAGELCRMAYVVIEERTRNGRDFSTEGEEDQILFFRDQKTGRRERLEAADIQKSSGKNSRKNGEKNSRKNGEKNSQKNSEKRSEKQVRLELDFQGTEADRMEVEIRAVETGLGREDEVLVRRKLAVEV